MRSAVVTEWMGIFMVRGFARPERLAKACLFLLLLFPASAFAQFTYTIDQSIPVNVNGRNLSMPWAGGINSAQVNTIDFDGDGVRDIVIFDRSANKLLPYRNTGSRFQYAPDYETLFPKSVSQWMLLRDFNCDGKKDLFTSDPFGISVFVNTTKSGQALSWRPFNPGFPLLTKGFSGSINLKINDVDIPAIDDVDNDGDLDILSMRFVGIGTVEWHKNMSVELAGKCDSLQLERVTQTYGGVQECTCGVVAFNNQPCPTNAGRVQHVGGKALLTLDTDGDGDRELLFSEESCATLFMFRNVGTKEAPVFANTSVFPAVSPASFPLFPTPYLEDVDFDGLADIVASPNLYQRTFQNVLVRNSLWFYKNTGTAVQPTFTFVKNNFLQEDMIDGGDYSAPALIDADRDGDEDLFVGYYANQQFRGYVEFYRNVGTATEPSFELVDPDYAALSTTLMYNVKPQFADMNGDGNIDFAFTATSLQDGFTTLHYFPNRAELGLNLDFGRIVTTSFRLGQAENARVVDVNNDGIPDILIGRASGSLQYLRNASDNGLFDQLTLETGTYLGLGSSTSRQNPAVVTADLDADGLEDLVMTDQRGNVSFYGDFRNFDPTVFQPQTDAIYNGITKVHGAVNFGGRLYPAVGNVFNSDKPAVVLGNVLGGLFVLRNNLSETLPEEPEVWVSPNPWPYMDKPLIVKSDRNTKVQIFSLLGVKMTEQFFLPANQEFALLSMKEAAAGMYIARFTFPRKTIAFKFVIK